MTTPTIESTLPEPGETSCVAEDLAGGLQATLVSVVITALTEKERDPAFLEGALSLARSMAAYCGVPWRDMVLSLCCTPELWHVVH
jgi:hypothetical protein